MRGRVAHAFKRLSIIEYRVFLFIAFRTEKPQILPTGIHDIRKKRANEIKLKVHRLFFSL